MLERSGLESVTVGSVDVVNTKPKLAILVDTSCGNLDRAVCGIVKDLDLEKLARIPDLAYGVDEPLHHVHLVVNRKLHCHPRLNGQLGCWLRDLVFVLQI